MSAISAKAGQVTRGRDNLKWFLRIGMLPLIASSILVLPENSEPLLRFLDQSKLFHFQVSLLLLLKLDNHECSKVLVRILHLHL